MEKPTGDDAKRLGRAVVFVHQYCRKFTDPAIRAEIEVILLAGKAMDFASRLKGYGTTIPITHALAVQFAKYAGLGTRELTQQVLPALKSAGLIDYGLDSDGNITRIEEFVGVSATVVEQTVHLLAELAPTRADLAFLHSVEIGAIAPLGRTNHIDQVMGRGFSDEEAEHALVLTRATGLNQEVPSADLGEPVIFSPNVWGTKQISLAGFLSNLPPNERDALLGLSETVLHTPGLHVNKLNIAPAMLRSAQSVGLLQTASVKSATGASSTYAFSPLLEVEDNSVSTTEALHLRKLFVAHILFGHEQATMYGGRIASPTVLVNALVRRGRVGPATNIGTDYHLLEMAGVVSVDDSGKRPYLDLVKPEIAEAGLEWIRKITDPSGSLEVQLGRQPAAFTSPEENRTEDSDGATREIMVSSVNELRKEMQRAIRRDDPWA